MKTVSQTVQLWTLLFVIGSFLNTAKSCKSSNSGSSRTGRRSPDFDGPDRSRYSYSIGRIHRLNSGDELVALTSNIRASTDRGVYGRLEVPRRSYGHWRLTVSAFWTGPHRSTPLWMYLKKNTIPTNKSFDKSSIAFVSRKFARIRMDRASPGSYFVLLEALVDLRNVTLGVTLIPSRLVDKKAVPIFTEIQYRPEWESEWISQNEVKK
eukprot:TRINITY_DN8470_c0_g1_i1.p1 TRINITY_DN8470_c0_g1~~TRINITY_DN8470_c0_g1_i1.p1  ORF type:complete len:209 (+),score=7.73 TRINITY_DN8470_c0_g1_i1:208-834(+)